MENLLMCFVALAANFIFFNNVVLGIVMLRIYSYDEYLRLYVRPWEAALYGLVCLALPDRRNPRATEIKELKRQIKSLRGNSSVEATTELKALETDLKAIRQEAVDVEKEARRIDDLARYRLHKSDIDTERSLREMKTRQIAEMNQAELEARREAYELE